MAGRPSGLALFVQRFMKNLALHKAFEIFVCFKDMKLKHLELSKASYFFSKARPCGLTAGRGSGRREAPLHDSLASVSPAHFRISQPIRRQKPRKERAKETE